MRTLRPSTSSAFLALFLSIAGAAAACGGGNAGGPGPQPPSLDDAGATTTTTTTTPTASATTTPTASATASATPTTSASTAKPPPEMKNPIPSAMVADLKKLGLDTKKLPPLDKLDPKKLRQVMDLFTKSLGVECTGCHVKNDFKASTPHKNIASHMWDDFVRVYELADGKAMFCDSCHQGRDEILDRTDRKKLAKFMSDAFVDKLARKDKKDLDCASCHGDITAPPFLDKWAKAGKH